MEGAGQRSSDEPLEVIYWLVVLSGLDNSRVVSNSEIMAQVPVNEKIVEVPSSSDLSDLPTYGT